MKKIILGFILILSSGYANAQSNIEKDVTDIAAKYKAIGVSYVVIKNDKIIHENAIGYQSIEEQKKLDVKNSVFRIASISKSFTATALMQLVQEGKISLDDDFGKLIGFPVRNPKFPDDIITLRMVLSHTSSINDVNGYFDLDVINPSINKDWAKSYNAYKPGTEYQYCNLNFNMSGAVLERLTNKRFDVYIKDQILNPLGLYGGYCVDSLDQSRLTSLYAYDNKSKEFEVQPAAYNPRREEIQQYVIGQSTPIFSPTGGMKISAHDLAIYMQMHMNYGKAKNKRILKKKYAQEMQTKLSEKDGYGLALKETNNLIKGEALVGHTGSAYGVYSSMFFNPKKKFGIVVITNGCIPTYENGNVAVIAEITNYLYSSLINK